MAVTVASLRAAHPEFSDATYPSDAEIQAKLDYAEAFLDRSVLGDSADDAVDLMACQLLARSPFARDLRLQKDSMATIYDAALDQILETYGRALRLLS